MGFRKPIGLVASKYSKLQVSSLLFRERMDVRIRGLVKQIRRWKV